MDKEVINLEIELSSTYMNDKRLAKIEREIREAVEKAVAKVDPSYAPVFAIISLKDCYEDIISLQGA